MDRHNPFDTVKTFEQQIAEFTGAPYAVAVDTCTAALFLALKRSFDTMAEFVKLSYKEDPPRHTTITIPRRTFVSVPVMAMHAGYSVRFAEIDWQDRGYYKIEGTHVYDAALLLREYMFGELTDAVGVGPVAMCISFQYRKPLPIGRGGMILHNWGEEADTWFRRARFFGREEVPASEDPGPTMLGWHMYMEPERAAKGLSHFVHYPDEGVRCNIDYPDISKYPVFMPHTADNIFTGES